MRYIFRKILEKFEFCFTITADFIWKASEWYGRTSSQVTLNLKIKKKVQQHLSRICELICLAVAVSRRAKFAPRTVWTLARKKWVKLFSYLFRADGLHCLKNSKIHFTACVANWSCWLHCDAEQYGIWLCNMGQAREVALSHLI